jgi:hypothetical protein
MSEGTEVIESPTVTVGYRDTQLIIAPLKVGQIPKFLRAVRPLLDDINPDVSATAESEFLSMIADHGERLIEAASIATGQSIEWLSEGDADEFGVLVKAIIEVNSDFFTRKVVPLLQVATKPNGVGATAFNS